MPFSGLSDMDIVRLAKIGVPADMMSGLLTELHGRVKKYADGGAVTSNWDWIKPADAAQLLALPEAQRLGIPESVLRQAASKASPMNAAETYGKATGLGRVQGILGRMMKSDDPNVKPGVLEDAARYVNKWKPSDLVPSFNLAEPSKIPTASTAPPAPTPTPSPQMPPMAIDPPPPLPPELRPPAPQMSPLAAAAAPPVPKPQPAKKPAPKASVAKPKPVQEAPKPPVDAPSDPLAPDTMPVPPMRPEEPAASPMGAATADPEGKSPPAWASPLMAAGFALMASKNANLGQALGEAGLAGVSQFQQDEQGRRQDKRLDREERRLDQQATLSREGMQLQKDYYKQQADISERNFIQQGMDKTEARKMAEKEYDLRVKQLGMDERKTNAYVANQGKSAQDFSPGRLAWIASGSGPEAQQAAKALEFYRERPDAQAKPVSRIDILKIANDMVTESGRVGVPLTMEQALARAEQYIKDGTIAPTGPSFPGIKIPGMP